MKVFVTGATGLVGAHTARALLDAGHEVRLLVRDENLARTYFAGHGYPIDDFIIGDMRDTDTVKAGLEGCEGIVHAAALVSVDPKRADEIYRNNVAGIDSVIGSACALGIERIVYVSSLSVLMQPNIDTVNERTPLGNPVSPYGRSKRACDEHVRCLQEDGHPIQITYPSGIFAPDDPKMSEANKGVATMLRTIPVTSSGLQIVDARDLGAMHARLIEQGPASAPIDRRFITAGPYFPWNEFHVMLEALVERNIVSIPLPGALLRGIGRLNDWASRIVPFESQITYEAMSYASQWVTADASKIEQHTGVNFRPGSETFADTIRWLVADGHVPPKLAGALAP